MSEALLVIIGRHPEIIVPSHSRDCQSHQAALANITSSDMLKQAKDSNTFRLEYQHVVSMWRPGGGSWLIPVPFSKTRRSLQSVSRTAQKLWSMEALWRVQLICHSHARKARVEWLDVIFHSPPIRQSTGTSDTRVLVLEDSAVLPDGRSRNPRSTREESRWPAKISGGQIRSQ